jgi:hypothetical protein
MNHYWAIVIYGSPIRHVEVGSQHTRSQSTVCVTDGLPDIVRNIDGTNEGLALSADPVVNLLTSPAASFHYRIASEQ